MNAVDLYAEIYKIVECPIKSKAIVKLVNRQIGDEFLKIIFELEAKYKKDCDVKCECEK